MISSIFLCSWVCFGNHRIYVYGNFQAATSIVYVKIESQLEHEASIKPAGKKGNAGIVLFKYAQVKAANSEGTYKNLMGL